MLHQITSEHWSSSSTSSPSLMSWWFSLPWWPSMALGLKCWKDFFEHLQLKLRNNFFCRWNFSWVGNTKRETSSYLSLLWEVFTILFSFFFHFFFFFLSVWVSNPWLRFSTPVIMVIPRKFSTLWWVFPENFSNDTKTAISQQEVCKYFLENWQIQFGNLERKIWNSW